MKDPAALYAQFKPGQKELQQIIAFAAKDTIDLTKVIAPAKTDILERFQSMMARQIWRNQGYYEVSNQTDPMIKKALEVMR